MIYTTDSHRFAGPDYPGMSRKAGLGNGSLEQDGPLCLVAMEGEEQARLMHQHRRGK